MLNGTKRFTSTILSIGKMLSLISLYDFEEKSLCIDGLHFQLFFILFFFKFSSLKVNFFHIRVRHLAFSSSLKQLSHTRTGFLADAIGACLVEHSLQKILPQFLQWCLRMVNEKALPQPIQSST